MGVIMELYEKMVNGTLTKEEEKELHDMVINQHDKPDQPAGLYNPDKCPCEFGICSECTK